MNYCIDVWGDMCKCYLEPLVKLQKKVLRIISYSGFNSNVDNVFKKLEIMQIKKIRVYKVALVMFKVKDLSAPAVLRALFRENKSVHDYDTRQRENFHVPQANRNYLRLSISCKGVPYGIVLFNMSHLIVLFCLLNMLSVSMSSAMNLY